MANLISFLQLPNFFFLGSLQLAWEKSKRYVYKEQSFCSRSYLGYVLLNCLLAFCQPWWFMHKWTFVDYYNEHSKDLMFQYNDALLFASMFIKMSPIYIFILQLTQWTDPKAQRCCAIFGVTATPLFGLKALMKEDPIQVVIYAFLFSLTQLSISLQLFEREVDENFANITTAMWNVIITLTTVGYGDYFPKTNFGRFVGVITAFWGVFFVSLFVVALTNTLELEDAEVRSFTLLRRLFVREQLRQNAAMMIACKYKMSTELAKQPAE